MVLHNSKCLTVGAWSTLALTAVLMIALVLLCSSVSKNHERSMNGVAAGRASPPQLRINDPNEKNKLGRYEIGPHVPHVFVSPECNSAVPVATTQDDHSAGHVRPRSTIPGWTIAPPRYSKQKPFDEAEDRAIREFLEQIRPPEAQARSLLRKKDDTILEVDSTTFVGVTDQDLVWLYCETLQLWQQVQDVNLATLGDYSAHMKWLVRLLPTISCPPAQVDLVTWKAFLEYEEFADEDGRYFDERRNAEVSVPESALDVLQAYLTRIAPELARNRTRLVWWINRFLPLSCSSPSHDGLLRYVVEQVILTLPQVLVLARPDGFKALQAGTMVVQHSVQQRELTLRECLNCLASGFGQQVVVLGEATLNMPTHSQNSVQLDNQTYDVKALLAPTTRSDLGLAQGPLAVGGEVEFLLSRGKLFVWRKSDRRGALLRVLEASGAILNMDINDFSDRTEVPNIEMSRIVP